MLKKCGYSSYLLILFCVFCVIFDPPLFFSFNILHVIGAASIGYICYHVGWLKRNLRKKKYITSIFIPCIILAYLFVTVVLGNGESKANAIIPFFFILDIIPFSYALRIYLNRKHLSNFDFIQITIVAGTLQAILCWMAFFIPWVQHFFVGQLLNYGYTGSIKELTAYRMYGYAASLTFSTPIVQSVIAILILFVANSKKGTTSKRNTALMCVLSIFVFSSAIINGRISIVVFLIGVISLVLFEEIPLYKKILFLSELSICILIVILLILPWIENESPYTYTWIMDGFDEILLLLKGNTSGGTITYLTSAEKYQLPNDIWGCLFGKGHVTTGMKAVYGYASDIGYINDIWLGGFIYAFMLYSVFLKMLLRLSKASQSDFRFIAFFLMILYPILNIKGTICTMNDLSNLLVMLYILEISDRCHD